MLDVPGVAALHDLHFWTLTSGVDCLSVHVRVQPGEPAARVRARVEHLLNESVGIEHATIQIEDAEERDCAVASQHR